MPAAPKTPPLQPVLPPLNGPKTRTIFVAAWFGLGCYLFRILADAQYSRQGDNPGSFGHFLAADFSTHAEYLVAIALAALALLPGVGGVLSRAVDHLRRPAPRLRVMIAAIVFVATTSYLLLNAVASDRDLFPKIHDEFIHLIQAQMLARGRLWMPPHPLADFFDSYFMAVRNVYAATPFPGASLLWVPGVWLGIPPWMTAALIAGGVATLLYGVVTELIDGVAGLLAVLLLLSIQMYRLLGTLTMSYIPMAGIVLGVVWCYMRWRRAIDAQRASNPSPTPTPVGSGVSRSDKASKPNFHLIPQPRRAMPWAAAMGALAGWGAITRPLDAACLILPLGVAMLWALRRLPRRRAGPMVAAAVLAAAPFLVLQLVFDKGLTGHWLRPPISEYGRENFPGLEMGYRPHPEAVASPSPRVEVRDFFDRFLRDNLVKYYGRTPIASAFLNERLLPTADVALPARLLYLFLPIGLLGLRRRPGAAATCVAGVLILPLAQTFWPPWVRFYAVASASGFILLALLGADVLRRRFPRVGAALAIAIAVIAIGALPELRGNRERLIPVPALIDINQEIRGIEHLPAVVLFHYKPKEVDADGEEHYPSDVFEEPVYNIDAASPDDAEVIRANDLGEARNQEIFRYYAARQPQRYFYAYDRSKIGSFRPLGWSRDLAK